MNYKIVLCLMLVNYTVSAFPKSDDNDQDKGDDDQENEYEHTIADEEFNTDSITEKLQARYEVTELVIDIPDNRTKGPIVTNYTIYKPLNTILKVDANKEIIENITKPNCNKKTTVVFNKSEERKKSAITIFHVKAEFEDKTEETTPQIVDFPVPHLSGLTDYFHGIKQGILNGFNSIIHKRKREDEGFETLGPLAFLSKLHKKSRDTAHRIHDVVFGHTIEEHF